nr:hypothetical protein [Escherichia coli]
MPSCFFKGWAFGFYNVMLSGVFKAVLLGNTLQFRVIAEIFQGGFVVFQQQFSKVHFEAAREKSTCTTATIAACRWRSSARKGQQRGAQNMMNGATC